MKRSSVFFFSFAFTHRFQFPLRIWWFSVGHPRVHETSPEVLLVIAISLLSVPDGSCMAVKCGWYLSTGAHRERYDVHDSVKMLVESVESVVSWPKSEDGSLVRFCQLVVTVLLLSSL